MSERETAQGRCEVLADSGGTCGNRAFFRYPADGGGWMRLCIAHGEPHANYSERWIDDAWWHRADDVALPGDAPQVCEWRDIATAPRDKTRIVVLMPDGRIDIAEYTEYSEPRATHWLPRTALPVAPAPVQETTEP